jgi:4-hydroxy-tetrahydrodipicolinate reductase
MAVGEYERLTITHESFSRRAFANGALHAAKYIAHRKGYFEMADIVSTHPLVNFVKTEPWPAYIKGNKIQAKA